MEKIESIAEKFIEGQKSSGKMQAKHSERAMQFWEEMSRTFLPVIKWGGIIVAILFGGFLTGVFLTGQTALIEKLVDMGLAALAAAGVVYGLLKKRQPPGA